MHAGYFLYFTMGRLGDVLHQWSPLRWHSNRVVSMLDSGAEGSGFKSQSRRCQVTVSGKLFTPIVPLRVSGVTVGLAEWQLTAGFMTHVTCRLTAKNRDQLQNPTLGNRVWLHLYLHPFPALTGPELLQS